MVVFDEFFTVLHWNKLQNIVMSVVFIVLLYFIDFKMYIFAYFSISENELFYSQWHIKNYCQ